MGNFTAGLKSSTLETLFSEKANPCENQMSHWNYKTANIVRVELRLLCTPCREQLVPNEKESALLLNRQPVLQIHSGILNLAQKHPPKNDILLNDMNKE